MPPLEPPSRRDFVRTAGTVALGASLFADQIWAQRSSRRRYAVVGTVDRGSGIWAATSGSDIPTYSSSSACATSIQDGRRPRAYHAWTKAIWALAAGTNARCCFAPGRQTD